MGDLGDLIALAPLGDEPATVPLDMYLRTLAALYVARQERDEARFELVSARQEIARLHAAQEDR